MPEVALSIIVPAYRQEKTIFKDLQRIYSVAKNIRYSSELICVVDGFVDKTYEAASKLISTHPNIRIIGYQKNMGKGYAVRYGMANSRGKIVIFIDAGSDINPNGISMLLEHFEWYKADIIVGSKRHPVSKVTYPWQRRILSWGYQMLTRTLFGLKIKDTQVGLKLYRKEVLVKVLPRLMVKRFAFDIEILAVAYELGFRRIFEAPVELELNFGSGSSVISKGFWRTVFYTLWDTLAIWYRLKVRHWYADSNKPNWLSNQNLTPVKT